MEHTDIHSDSSIKPCPQCGTGVRFRVDTQTQRRSCPHCGYVLPNQIGHFMLNEIIGAGGMGAVYRGLDTSLERPVAVKVIREELAKNPQFVENFTREARATAALNHPNVAQLYTFGEQNSRYYLVMEILPNGSLDDRIENEHRLHELEVLDIGIQITNGLKAAYERGLIHRDVKPGNILFGQDGTAKVVDFGLARYEGKAGQSHQEEGIWGTPYYIAPEKVADNKEDFRSDIYSLGGTLFHALAGRAPFEAATSTEVVMKHLNAAAVSLRAFAPDCTPQTAEVIGRMLKRNPADRPQSYDDLLNDLAYAKRFALEKKPTVMVVEKDELPMGLLIGTLATLLLCIVGAVFLWIYRAKLFSETGKPPSKSMQVEAVGNNTTQVKPAITPVKPPPPPPPDYAEQIDAAHGLVSRGKADYPNAITHLKTVGGQLPINHALHPWIKLEIARIQMLMGNDAEATKSLSTLADAFAPSVSITPEQYPQALAFILLGKLPVETRDKLVPSLPPWMQAIASFDTGLAALKRGQLEETAKLWRDYAKIEGVKEQSWTLSFQPMARDFAYQVDEFKKVNQNIGELQVKKQFSEIKKLLEDNQGKWSHPLIQDHIAKVAVENRQALAAIQKEQEEKTKAEHARLREEENKLLEAERAKRQPLMAAYQFEPFLKGWKTLEVSIKTEENRKIVSYQVAVAQCLADYKSGIARDVAAFPYDQERIVTKSNKKMMGKLAAIRDDKLLFQVQYGEMGCAWAELPPSAVLELGDFYFLRAQKEREPNNKDLAQRALALAVFTREYNLSDNKLRAYLSQANQTGADIKEMMEKLFPPNPGR